MYKPTQRELAEIALDWPRESNTTRQQDNNILFTEYKKKWLLRSAHMVWLVPATSPCSKSQGLIASCELAIVATKFSRNLVPATSPRNSNWFEFVGVVAEIKVGPCD